MTVFAVDSEGTDEILEASSISSLPKKLAFICETREQAEEFVEWRKNSPRVRIQQLEQRIERLREAASGCGPAEIKGRDVLLVRYGLPQH